MKKLKFYRSLRFRLFVLIVAVGMMALSYVTPHIPLFLDPSTGLYGVPQGIQ